MSMIEWVRCDNKKKLILFVHGLKGGSDTWRYDKENCFPDMMSNDVEIENEFDIACFNYFTTFTNTYGVSKSLFKRFFSSSKAIKKNLPITELAELLNAEFDVHLNEYEKIIIIAHSLGGLVSKACILKQLRETECSSVVGFISLAVPHSGAKIANIGALISSNVQLDDLGLMSDVIDQLTREWIESTIKPHAKYIYAAHDPFVDKKSALAIGSQKGDSIAVDEDHFTICKPKDCNQTVYKAVKNYIKQFDDLKNEKLEIKELADENQYDNHVFVLKIILADIHLAIGKHAKSYFFNAEEARKIFSSEHDMKILGKLYSRIENIYSQEYEHHLAHKTTSDIFIQSVHRRIFDERDDYLKCALGQLEDQHKKGMLHQLADKNNLNIVWSADTTLDALKKLKGKKDE